MRYVTAGESHGKALIVIIEGMPAGLPLAETAINHELKRRQAGYGRGMRMKTIERDAAEIISGVRRGYTLGSPISIMIRNADWEHNALLMAVGKKPGSSRPLQSVPRPGHADFAGMIKFSRHDIQDVLERASARETAARVAAGAVCKSLLDVFAITMMSWVVSIGTVSVNEREKIKNHEGINPDQSPVRCPVQSVAKRMMRAIDRAQSAGNTLGGVFQIEAHHCPIGLGSGMQWDIRLDGRIAHALMAVQAIKGVEIGAGFATARMNGSAVHDAFSISRGSIVRPTNNAGGIEGGMTNGSPLVVRAAMKPIATLVHPLPSVDMAQRKASRAPIVRSDVCAVPAASVIGESVVAIELARTLKEKFGGDSLSEMKANWQQYQRYVRKRVQRP
ncbi:MAG: chorismate synthase [Elusimicrobia bacterium]|nr:chorismate synthase [Elusimicrobiota bacterium]MBD3412755.1 chorismate synthase [Elusimicrobiota bacterium]